VGFPRFKKGMGREAALSTGSLFPPRALRRLLAPVCARAACIRRDALHKLAKGPATP
jgi:hypothetical protein